MGKEEVGYLAKIIFSYAIIHLKVKDKVRFYYALKGRDGKSGVLKFYNIEQLGKTVLLVDKKQEQAVEQFLTQWKCKYQKREVFVKK